MTTQKTQNHCKSRCALSRRLALLGTAAAAAALTGCAGSVTGLIGAQEDFGCPASGGVNCTTVSATYERESRGEPQKTTAALTGVTSSSAADRQVPADARIRVTSTFEDADREKDGSSRSATSEFPAQTHSRAPERVVMLWILPWVDSAGDLHSDSRVWMRVRDASWRIESVRTRAMQTSPLTTP